MASLPAGWAADYDGTRWFFRYAATDHTQYHFPTPGDEFPDFYSSLLAPNLGSGGSVLLGPLEGGLSPEERLESERQVRKRAAGDGGGRRNREADGAQKRREEEDDGGEGICLEAFGYLGPGSYDDFIENNGVDDDHDADGGAGDSAAAAELPNHGKRRPSVDAVSSLASVGTEHATAPVSEPLNHRTFAIVVGERHQQQQEQHPESHHAATKLPSSSSATPSALSHEPFAAHPAHCLRPDEVPLLDSLEITPSPVGNIAELVSESTARCEEEINPPPVELPDTNGASWLEPVPLPNLVNQYPVELPAVKSCDSVLETLGARRDVVVGSEVSWEQKRVVEGTKSTWQTNWMSNSATATTTTSAQAQAQEPPRPPKVVSRSDLPSRSGPENGNPPRSSPHESLQQEILEFFPAEPQPHERADQSDPLKIASLSSGHNEDRHLNIPPNPPPAGRVPSVLRPGPRRSSPPPFIATTPTDSRHSSLQASSQPQGTFSQASIVGPEFKAFNPNPAAKSRPHSQSVAEHTSTHRQPVNEDSVIRMPNPKDHVRGLHLPRSSTLPAPELQQPSVSPPMHGPRREPLHFVIPVYHSPTARGAASALEPSPNRDALCRPCGFVKMPSEPAKGLGMVPEPSPPMLVRRASDDAPELYFVEESPGSSPSSLLPHKTSISTVARPETDVGAPPARVESVSTAFAAMGASGPGHNRLRKMLKRIGRVDRGEGNSGNKPPFMLVGEEGSQPLPHDYIPPKGRQKEASEWSLGHVG